MPIVRTGETEFDKEMAKWDTPKRLGGFAPDGYEPFPKMLYKAHRRENGKVMCMDMDALYATDLAVAARAEAFNNTCMTTVGNQQELDRELANGWRHSPKDALDYQEALAQDISKAAAEVNYSVQRMSDKAKSEHARADASTDAPVVDVVAAPKKRGRKPNAPMVTVP